ncbi:MAG: hypothetical protein J5556_03500, partial [Deltaproteobacteria bacterium]|nr:hypothetical protein [Deltaproteobacteria bacterium]
MSGHGGFSVTGQGMNRPQVFDPSKAEEIKIGGGKLDALNIEGRKPGAPAADTRLDQANRVI